MVVEAMLPVLSPRHSRASSHPCGDSKGKQSGGRVSSYRGMQTRISMGRWNACSEFENMFGLCHQLLSIPNP